MNLEAIASAKRDPADLADDERRLERLEQWAAATMASEAVRHAVEHPEAEMHALRVLQAAKSRQQLARLEAWAAAAPPGPTVDERERQRVADRMAKANAYSYALRSWMANGTPCGVCWSCRVGGSCIHHR
jgi:hypothetical protein